jgi:hypothetical protein
MNNKGNKGSGAVGEANGSGVITNTSGGGGKSSIAIDDIQNYDISQSNFILQLDRLCKSRLHSGKPIFLMASAGYDNTINCSGWKSLLRSCLTIQLPYAIKNLT